VNGSGPFDFLVDTGAQITTVDQQLASQLGLATTGTTGVSGVATYGRKAFTQLAQVEVADRRVTDVLAVVDNLAQLHTADGKIRGILGENFLAHFDLLIDNLHHVLCLDDAGAMAAAIKGTRVALAHPYGADHDLPFTRPLVIEAHIEGIRNPILFRLDSGSNVPLIYGGDMSLNARTSSQILKREVDGAEQAFAVLQPKDVSVGGDRVRRVIFVEPLSSIGKVRESREDGLLPTQLFQRVFVSYSNQFAILDPR
jgi:predicted aspartyl protease